MASIIDRIYDLTDTVPFIGATVAAYLANAQSSPLTDVNGVASTPVGSPVAIASTGSLGGFVLNGLTAGVVYDLYVDPSNGPPFWLPGRVPDIAPTATPCHLYGTVDTNLDLVWAILELPAVVSGGVRVANGSVYSTVSIEGSFSLTLWPTNSLTPHSLYRVHIGTSIYRGSIPTQASIKLEDWIALPTTLQLA